MATHSSVLAWRIPGTVEPGGLLFMGSHKVGHDWSNLAAAAAMIPACKTLRLNIKKKQSDQIRSFAQSCLTLRPHESQQARPPCPSPTPGVHSNVCPPSLSMPSNHLILCHSLLLLPSIFPSIRVFSNELVLWIRGPKYWSFSFSVSVTNGYSVLISFWMDWLDLLAVQGILKSLLQHHSSKASILQSSAFFIVQLSHPYMTTGKTIALPICIFVDKVMSMLFVMMYRFVISFLPRRKYLSILWLHCSHHLQWLWSPPK